MNFSYKAVNNEGNTIKGNYECVCEDELIKNLREHGYYLIDYAPCKNGVFKNMFRHTDILTVSLICKQMSVTLKSGIMLPEALIMCRNSCKKRIYKKSLDDIYHAVISGESISRILEENKKLYPFLMAQMVRMGENNGTISAVMEQLSMYYEKEYKVKNKIKSSLTYPFIVFLSTVLIFMILMSKVVPQFVNTLSAMNAQIPVLTLHLMNICSYIRKYAFYVLIYAAAIVFLIKHNNKFYKVRYKRDKLRLKLPYTGRMIKKINEVRFINVMYMMMSCGYNSLEALKDSCYIIDNIIIKEKIQNCIFKITKGEQMSQSLESIGILSPIFISLFKAGEKSGEIKECIKKARDIINGSMDENIKIIITCIEPFFIVVLALIICIMIFCLIMPLMNIMDSIYMGL